VVAGLVREAVLAVAQERAERARDAGVPLQALLELGDREPLGDGVGELAVHRDLEQIEDVSVHDEVHFVARVLAGRELLEQLLEPLVLAEVVVDVDLALLVTGTDVQV